MHKTNNHLRLWVTSSKVDITVLEERLYPNMSTSEQLRYLAINNPNKQREYLVSRSLIRHCWASATGGAGNVSIIEQPNNKPRVYPNLPDQHYSLSHSHGVVIIALASAPIGVDIEFINLKRNTKETAKEFMSATEYKTFLKEENFNPEHFYKIWSQKESLYKAVPTHIQTNLMFTQFNIDDYLMHNGFSAYHTTYGDHFVSAIAQGKIASITLHTAQLENDGTFTDRYLPLEWNATKDG